METILAAVDFSDVTAEIIAEAKRLALALNAELLLLHVEPPEPDFVGYGAGPQSVRDNVAKDIRHHHQELDELAAALRRDGPRVKELFVQGPIAKKILEKSRQHEARLIVMGSHGHGALRHLLLGSVTEAVLREAPCPLIIVRHEAAENGREENKG